MKQIELKTIKELKKVAPPLELIRIGLLINQGHTVIVEDHENNREFIVRQQEHDEN